MPVEQVNNSDDDDHEDADDGDEEQDGQDDDGDRSVGGQRPKLECPVQGWGEAESLAKGGGGPGWKYHDDDLGDDDDDNDDTMMTVALMVTMVKSIICSPGGFRQLCWEGRLHMVCLWSMEPVLKVLQPGESDQVSTSNQM